MLSAHRGRNLKMRCAALVEMTNRRCLGFDVLKGGLALSASALRLATIVANQFDVTNDSVGAEMSRDGVIVDGAGYRSLFGHSLRYRSLMQIFPSSQVRAFG